MYRRFRGTNTEYRVLHYWVERMLGRPSKCWECGTVVSKRFEWANISGEYKKELSDWKRMCTACHMRKDRESNYWTDNQCRNGHRLTVDNLYLRKHIRGHQYLECRQCSADSRKKYRQKVGS